MSWIIALIIHNENFIILLKLCKILYDEYIKHLITFGFNLLSLSFEKPLLGTIKEQNYFKTIYKLFTILILF